MGLDALRLRRVEARADGDRRRARGVVQEEPRRLQGAAPRGVRGIAEDQHREDSKIQVERDAEGYVKPRIQTCAGCRCGRLKNRNANHRTTMHSAPEQSEISHTNSPMAPI